MLRSILAAALDVLAPETCAFCGASRRGQAWFCWPGPGPTGLRPWHAPHLCRACFESRSGDVIVGAVAERPLATPLPTSSELTRAVGLWKYHGVRGLGAPLAAWLAPVLVATMDARPASVVPVPLHRARRRARGFDQVVDLARLAAMLASLPLAADVLQRQRATRQQASQDTVGDGRAANVADAFACRPPRDGEPRDLLLVDDLATTGATLAAAATVLAASGWTVVGYAALGQARRLVQAEGQAEGLDTGGLPTQSVARTDAT